MKIVLGITGSVAAYKAPDIVRRLKEQGHDVRVVMTSGALAFIQPLTLQAVTGYPVVYDLLDPQHEAGMGHIELARWADMIIIAPCSAHTLAKLNLGLADNLLTAMCLATERVIALAPAMNHLMWSNITTQRHVRELVEKNVLIFGPDQGLQACGEVGMGRMIDPVALTALVTQFFQDTMLTIAPKIAMSVQQETMPEIVEMSTEQDASNSTQLMVLEEEEDVPSLQGKTVLITAGPTREAIDPVRFISNRSSGKMGYALAQAALDQGAKVILISGPVSLVAPFNAILVQVESALEMYAAVLKYAATSDIFIATAAVADYRVAEIALQKIKKQSHQSGLILELVENPDILKTIALWSEQRPFCVGFAAETQKIAMNAQDKLLRKNLDMICANDVSAGQVFDQDENTLHIFNRHGEQGQLMKASKTKIAQQLIELIAMELEQYHG